MRANLVDQASPPASGPVLDRIQPAPGLVPGRVAAVASPPAAALSRPA